MLQTYGSEGGKTIVSNSFNSQKLSECETFAHGSFFEQY